MEGAVPFPIPPDVWIAGALAVLALFAAIFDPPAEVVGGILMIAALTAALEYFWFRRRKG